MDLAKIRIVLRPRTPWEGIDLGFVMARHWFMPLWLLWMSSAFPVMLFLALAFSLPLWLLGLLLWWFKPLYEPPLLYWLSRVVFGERPSVREMRRGWWRMVWPHLLANLSFRRFNPSRSFNMPVVLLEGLRGKARSSRISVLDRNQHAASWLTIVGIHFEVALEFGLILLVVLLIPEDLLWLDFSDYFFNPDTAAKWLQQISSLLVMSLIAPFYVAAGFGLYLTRRSELEGWDLELGLRRMAKRLQLKQAKKTLASSVLLLLLSCTLPSLPLDASEIEALESKELIEQVLEDDDFGRIEQKTRWRYIGDTDQDNSERHWFIEWLLSVLEGFASGFAVFGELVMWFMAGLLLTLFGYWFFQNRQLLRLLSKRSGEPPVGTAPAVISGLDVRPESLPNDISGQALQLIETDQVREALSLLYRGALSHLLHKYPLEINQSSTESECLVAAVSHLTPGEESYFSRLTEVWQRLAYAHLLPERQIANTLCDDWRSHFGVADD